MSSRSRTGFLLSNIGLKKEKIQVQAQKIFLKNALISKIIIEKNPKKSLKNTYNSKNLTNKKKISKNLYIYAFLFNIFKEYFFQIIFFVAIFRVRYSTRGLQSSPILRKKIRKNLKIFPRIIFFPKTINFKRIKSFCRKEKEKNAIFLVLPMEGKGLPPELSSPPI